MRERVNSRSVNRQQQQQLWRRTVLICCHFYARTQAAQRGAPTLSHTHTHTDSLSLSHTLTHSSVRSLALCAIFDHVSHTFGSPRTADFVPRSRDAQVYKSNRLSPDSRPTATAAVSPFPLPLFPLVLPHESFVVSYLCLHFSFAACCSLLGHSK